MERYPCRALAPGRAEPLQHEVHEVFPRTILRRLRPCMSLSLLAASIALALLLAQPATAATTGVPAGTNLNILTPANGDIWNLQGDAYLSGASFSSAKALPPGTPGLTINGGTGGSTVTLNDGAGRYAYFSGGVTTLNLSNLTLTGGLVPTGANGAVINTTGALVLNTAGTVRFINNTAGRNGGVIYATQPVTINGSIIANNNSALNGSGGGVIYLTSGAITINGSMSMDGNFAGGPSNTSPGGALYAPGGISLAPTSGDVSLTNNLSNTSGGAASAGAGPIAVGNSAASITLVGNRAGFNTDGSQHSVGFGGVLRAGLITLTGRLITLSNNTATGNGGALYGNSGAMVSGDLVANGNVALVGAGGVIYTLAGDVTSNGNISMADNKAGSGGGGAIIAVNGNVNLSTSTGNVSLANNSASSHGGAINGSANVTLGNSSGTVTLSGNSAGFNLDGSQANSISLGGGIYSARAVTINGDLTTSGNTATAGGGAIYAAAGNVTVNGSLNANQNATSSPTGSGGGGAIDALAGDVTVSAGTVMDGNISTTGAGGAVVASSGNVSFAVSSGDVSLTNNTANGNGGAIYAGGFGSAIGNVVLGNSGSTLTISGNRAGFNSAGQSLNSPQIGGAIFSAGSTTLNGQTVVLSNNTATASGGGIFSFAGVTVNGALTANENAAGFGGSGGAIFASGGDVTVSNSVSMDRNTSVVGNFNIGGDGSAIDAEYGSIRLAAASGNTSLTNNSGGGSGGALRAGGEVALGNTSGALAVQSNGAGGNGGAIYAGSSVFLDAGSNSTISGNTAGGQGGALWSGGSLAITSSGGELSFTGNTAGGLGGAIYVDPTVLTLSAVGGDISFSGNTHVLSGLQHANAIYIANLAADTSLTLDAAAGHSITFYDPIQNDGSKGLITVAKTGDGIVSFDGRNFPTVGDVLDRWSKIYANTEVQAGTF